MRRVILNSKLEKATKTILLFSKTGIIIHSLQKRKLQRVTIAYILKGHWYFRKKKWSGFIFILSQNLWKIMVITLRSVQVPRKGNYLLSIFGWNNLTYIVWSLSEIFYPVIFYLWTFVGIITYYRVLIISLDFELYLVNFNSFQNLIVHAPVQYFDQIMLSSATFSISAINSFQYMFIQ